MSKIHKVISPLITLLLSNGVHSKTVTEEMFFPHYNAWDRGEEGCVFNGQVYNVGDLEAVNQSDLQAYKAQSGGIRASDGYAVLMMCSYLVTPDDHDHPKPEDRRFVWVAY